MASFFGGLKLGGHWAGGLESRSGNDQRLYSSRKLFTHDLFNDGGVFLAIGDIIFVCLSSTTVDYGNNGVFGDESLRSGVCYKRSADIGIAEFLGNIYLHNKKRKKRPDYEAGSGCYWASLRKCLLYSRTPIVGM